MKTMDGAHRPRIAWTVRAMFYYDDDINYLTATIVPFIHMYNHHQAVHCGRSRCSLRTKKL